MSRFFVGQKVKIVRPQHPQFTGCTGRITALFAERMGSSYKINCGVDWDIELGPEYSKNTHTSRLEPILPEGMQPVSWEHVFSLFPDLESIFHGEDVRG